MKRIGFPPDFNWPLVPFLLFASSHQRAVEKNWPGKWRSRIFIPSHLLGFFGMVGRTERVQFMARACFAKGFDAPESMKGITAGAAEGTAGRGTAEGGSVVKAAKGMARWCG